MAHQRLARSRSNLLILPAAIVGRGGEIIPHPASLPIGTQATNLPEDGALTAVAVVCCGTMDDRRLRST